ncbi:MAG: Rpn family recombination-promoting nuclease/putative transposase [Lachnospiraceae bacterium]|nr:Rpn family recombination-promoting nuclease/putative transposase [Lachnospiraceae bacterium]
MEQKTQKAKRTQKAQKLQSSKRRDSSAKLIFGDPILCSQFLRKYISIPLLKDVQPEDIEDVTERYVHMFTEERDSDVVKKVHMKGGEHTFYLVSLIEHKSNVDYNVVMQILRYMVFIWEDYEREMNRKHMGISRTKDFRYPPVLPVIFYDGMRSWTAATTLHERVLLSDVLGKYVPDYQCLLVQLKDYSNQDLMEKKDELSIVMMLDKLSGAADFAELGREMEGEYLEEAIVGAPEYLLELMAQIVEILLSRLNVPKEEVITFTNQIKERRMGELFSNFKGYDVQATRREAKAEGIKEGMKEGMGKLICALKELRVSDETIKTQLIKQYGLSDKEADKILHEYLQQ